MNTKYSTAIPDNVYKELYQKICSPTEDEIELENEFRDIDVVNEFLWASDFDMESLEPLQEVCEDMTRRYRNGLLPEEGNEEEQLRDEDEDRLYEALVDEGIDMEALIAKTRAVAEGKVIPFATPDEEEEGPFDPLSEPAQERVIEGNGGHGGAGVSVARASGRTILAGNAYMKVAAFALPVVLVPLLVMQTPVFAPSVEMDKVQMNKMFNQLNDPKVPRSAGVSANISLPNSPEGDSAIAWTHNFHSSARDRRDWSFVRAADTAGIDEREVQLKNAWILWKDAKLPSNTWDSFRTALSAYEQHFIKGRHATIRSQHGMFSEAVVEVSPTELLKIKRRDDSFEAAVVPNRDVHIENKTHTVLVGARGMFPEIAAEVNASVAAKVTEILKNKGLNLTTLPRTTQVKFTAQVAVDSEGNVKGYVDVLEDNIALADCGGC